MTQTSLHDHGAAHVPDDFDQFAASVKRRFAAIVPEGKLFYADLPDADTLWNAYLSAFPTAKRQEHNCHECRRFISNYGHLVVVDNEGVIHSALWDERLVESPLYRKVATKLRECVTGWTGKVSCAAFLDTKRLGNPVTGEWHHFGFNLPDTHRWQDRLLTGYQKEAQMLESFGVVQRSLQEYPADIVRQAWVLVSTGNVYRAEAVLGPLRWFNSLHQQLRGLNGSVRKHNLIWRAVVEYGNGGVNIRSSVVGSLLDDMVAGVPLDVAKKKFAEKLNPTIYQRPQTAPGEGNVKRAEEIIAKLGLETALQRRYARLSEVKLLWQPKASATRTGVFSGVTTRNQQPTRHDSSRGTPITWRKFAETVLPVAEKIQLLVPSGRARFAAYVTAMDPTAPPIIEWDREDARNPVSWYLYNGGSHSTEWGLSALSTVEVTGISNQPQLWDGGNYPHHGKGVLLILKGCRDQNRRVGSCLFPEILRRELHEVRKTIEAFSRDTSLQGYAQSDACGLMIADPMGSNAQPLTLRVTAGDTTLTYIVDRYD